MEDLMDLYTKIVLTVIAGALSVLAWRQVGTAYAQADAPTITHVSICDSANTKRCVGINDKGQLEVFAHPAN
jgi:hypothetical protein